MNYSTTLRVIGQNLEPLQPETYEVVCYSNSYLARCRVKEDSQRKKEKRKTGQRIGLVSPAVEGARNFGCS